MSTKVGDIFVRAALDTKEYNKGLQKLQSTSTSAASIIGGKMKAALAGIGLAAAAKALWSFANAVAAVGDQIDKQSQKVGMTAQAYQEWNYVMQRCGASMDSMTTAMRTLSSAAETGSEYFAELGISANELQTLSQEQLFERTITALQNVEDKTRRTYLATKLLGRGSMELGALLNMSAEDTAKLRNNLGSLGGVMSDVAVRNSAAFTDTMTDIKMALRSLYNTFAEYILPKLTAALNNYVIPVIQAIGRAFQWLAHMWTTFTGAFGRVGKMFGGIKNGISAALGKTTQKQTDKTASSIGKVNSGLSGTGSSAKGAKKQVQALKRELLGFDQITKLTKQDSAGGTGGGGLGGGLGGIGDLEGSVNQFQSIADKITDIFSKIKIPTSIQEALMRLRESFGRLWDVLSENGAWIWNEILKPLFDWLVNKGLPAAIDAIAESLDALSWILKHIGDDLKEVWDVLKMIGEWMDEHGIWKWVDKLMNPVGSAGGFGIFGGLVSGSGSGGGDATSSLQNIGKSIEGIGTSLGKLPTGKTVTLNVKDNITKTLDKVTPKVNKLAKTVTTKIALNNSSFKEKWNKFARKMNGLPKTSMFSFPKLPLLAEGGYVKKNTPQLAVIGDNRTQGEIVAPEDKLRQMAQEAANNSQMLSLLSQILSAIQNQNTNVYLDGKQIADNTVNHINRHTRQTGKLSIIM